MSDLWFYRALARFRFLNYRLKIMTMAFLGTHIPLISLSVYYAMQSSHDWRTLVSTIGVTLAATLGGTALTLFVLNELLRPVLRTSAALRAYRETRTVPELPNEFTDEVGTLMADANATLIHLEEVRDRLEHVDDTTGLANRKRFVQLIEARLATAEPFTVAALQVNNVPRITEALDAANVEAIMAVLTGRLGPALPPHSTLARIGQGQFALVMPRQTEGTTAQIVANLVAVSRAEVTLSGLAVRPAVFVGLADGPSDGDAADTLLDHAISAVAGATLMLPIAHHAPAAREAALQRLQIEEELRRALTSGEFRLHYQPVVDLGSGRVKGAEALIRWQHPELGLVPPGRFIPVAEASGLIHPIGLWTLREACRQIGAWNAGGVTGQRVAINLSARQFLDPELKRHVSEALSDARIDPSALEIELTETAAMTDQDETRRIFTTLRDLGLTIAIDDFGTGYASISYLRRLPFDKLKIDREFVTDVHKRRDGQAICGSMIALCQGLGLAVLAEGTETEEEVCFLRDLGCDLFQGFYFSRPAPAAEYGAAAGKLADHALMPGARAGALAPVDLVGPHAVGRSTRGPGTAKLH